ncbi:MAG TPA: hypothetical protein VFW03_25040, partial [Gemmatimonadaceae bacterium]|nr:hypothetical protein [Gemmatimonadaceae bacterium]
PNGAKSRTARNPERREIPNGAKSRTARNPERREIPKGGTAAGEKRRALSALRGSALRDFAPFGIRRPSAVRPFR